jgi:hypothetical protein
VKRDVIDVKLVAPQVRKACQYSAQIEALRAVRRTSGETV